MIPQIELFHLVSWIPAILVVEGFFAGSEIALLSADKVSLKKKVKQKIPGAELALEMTKNPQKILSTTLVYTSICVILISALVEIYAMNHRDIIPSWATILVTSGIIVIFGELLPKAIFRRFSNQLAPYVSGPLQMAYILLYPVTHFLSQYTRYVTRLVRPLEALITGKKATTRDVLQLLLKAGKNESEIRPSERRMIKRIFDFKDTEAHHALIPLVKVHAIDSKTSLREALELFEKHRHSRMPVFEDRVDHIVGVLEIFDIFSTEQLNRPVRDFMKPALYTAETQVLMDVLSDMKKADTEMTVVVDEYGGAVGILTFEDIFEEIVGEIHDEYDSESTFFRALSDSSWIVDARMEITNLNEAIKLGIPEGDYKTLSGFLLEHFGRIPEKGDELFIETREGSLHFIVRQANARRIESIEIALTARSLTPKPTH